MNKSYFWQILILLTSTRCSDFVEVNVPDNQVTTRSVFQDDRSAQAAMTGLYVEIAQQPFFTNGAISILSGLSSDELLTSVPDYFQFVENELVSENPRLLSEVWKPAYRYIYLSNVILEGISNPGNLVSVDLRKHLEGEARFIRSYCYFNLVNIYGNVPLVVSTDLERNSVIPRSDTDEVYALIESDLSVAEKLLPSTYIINGEAEERITVTSWAAIALHAKVSLYRQKWANAQALASLVIDDGAMLFELENNLSNVFIRSSKEAIWQIQSVVPNVGTWEANTFVPTDGVPKFLVSDLALDWFGSGDKRRYAWLDSIDNGTSTPYYFPHKYKFPVTQEEYHTELRLADLFLIRAEARAYLNDLTGCAEDIDMIRSRAGLEAIEQTDMDRETLIQIVRQERKCEFIAEGSRWYDLKRWGIASDVLQLIHNKNWEDTDVLYPIPQSEIAHNQSLLPQNDGY